MIPPAKLRAMAISHTVSGKKTHQSEPIYAGHSAASPTTSTALENIYTGPGPPPTAACRKPVDAYPAKESPLSDVRFKSQHPGWASARE
jgi:hypothetical protein